MACELGIEQIRPGVNVFQQHYKATNDFVASSKLAVKYLKENENISMTTEQFMVGVRDKFHYIFFETGTTTRFRNQKTADTYRALERALGVVGGKVIGSKGGRKAGKVDIEVQDKLNRIWQGINGSSAANLTEEESILVDTINTAASYGDHRSLREAVNQIKEIVETGTSTLEKKQKETQKEINETAEKWSKSMSRLSEKQFELDSAAKQMSETGEGDVDALIIEAKDLLNLHIPQSMRNNPKEVANFILDSLERKKRGNTATRIGGLISKAYGKMANYFTRDLGSILNVIDRKGHKLRDKNKVANDEGTLESGIDDELRSSKNQTLEDQEAHSNMLGRILAETYGVPMPTFKGKYASLYEADFLANVIREQAVRSAVKITDTGLRKNGVKIKLDRGELMQLYVDSLDPDVMVSMENAGINKNDLDVLVTKFLNQQDREFAMRLVSEFYPAVYAKENEVYKRIYSTNMPRLHNYGGMVRYKDSGKKKYFLDQDMSASAGKMQVALGNSIERGESNLKALDLNRNIFVNAVNRLNESAKFTGGAEVYMKVSGALNQGLVEATLNETSDVDYLGAINRKIQKQYGLIRTSDKLDPALTYIKRNFTKTALAFKPKLLLNQATSATVWLIEDAFWDGLKNRHPDLAGVNLTQIIYDNSASIRSRYKKGNIEALEAQIEDATQSADFLLKSKNKYQSGVDSLTDFGMSLIQAGDSVGIMMAGRYYFAGKYNAARAQGLDHNAALGVGIAKFNKHFQKTQQSYEIIDKSEFQTTKVGSLLTMFQTTPLQYNRVVFNSGRQLVRAASGEEYRGSIAYHSARLITFHVVAGVMYKMVMGAGLKAMLGNWGDEDDEELLWTLALGPWGESIPLLGDMIVTIKNEIMDETFNAGVGQTSAFAGLSKVALNMGKFLDLLLQGNLNHKQEDKMWSYLFNFFSEALQVTGVPTKSLGLTMDQHGNIDVAQMVEDMMDGKMEGVYRLLGYSRYSINDFTSKSKKKGKGKFKSKQL